MGLNTAAALQALRQRGKASLSDVEVKLLSRHKKNINTILRLSHQLTSLM
jgi:predicted CopG family antitoxin